MIQLTTGRSLNAKQHTSIYQQSSITWHAVTCLLPVLAACLISASWNTALPWQKKSHVIVILVFNIIFTKKQSLEMHQSLSQWHYVQLNWMLATMACIQSQDRCYSLCISNAAHILCWRWSCQNCAMTFGACYNRRLIFYFILTAHNCDRQTERQTDRQMELHGHQQWVHWPASRWMSVILMSRQVQSNLNISNLVISMSHLYQTDVED